MLLPILLAALAESIISFSGALAVIMSRLFAERLAHWVLGFAVGALLGVAFFDLLPEAVAGIGNDAFLWTVVGIFLFFALEKLVLWYHYHREQYHAHAYTSLVLVGDAVHNFIDGIALALAFLTSFPLGVATTIAVLLHEVPQEIADFGLLLRGGFGRKRALVVNFCISLTTIAGALLAYAFGRYLEPILPYALAVIAGNFLYLALSDLLPETHEHGGTAHFIGQILLMALGVSVMYFLGQYFAE